MYGARSFAIACLAWACATGLARAETAAAVRDPAAVPATAHRCPGGIDILVRAADADDAQMACDGATRALAFLSAAGIEAPPQTTIDIVRQLPGELAGKAVGCYLRQSRNILLLDYRTFEAGGRWFRVPVSRELYRAVAAHETAHAVIGCHTEPKGLPVAAHEYVAYVVLFATLEPGLRDQMLAQFPGSGFRTTLQISDVNHLVNPSQFGADAWRHYLTRRDREAWLREVIAGGVVPEPPGDAP